MTWEKFWSIIDRVRAQADMQDEASVKQFLYTELIKLPQDELLGFDCAYANFLEDKITGNDRDLTVTETGEIQQRCRELLEKCRET